MPDPGAPGRLAAIERACGTRAACLGPAREPGLVVASWERARSGLTSIELASLPAGLHLARDLLATIAIVEARDPLRELAARRLDPLGGLTPRGRERMTLTLAAYLEHRASTQLMASALNVHPQTVRYRVAQLRDLFGAALDEPDARFELEASLRAERVTGALAG